MDRVLKALSHRYGRKDLERDGNLLSCFVENIEGFSSIIPKDGEVNINDLLNEFEKIAKEKKQPELLEKIERAKTDKRYIHLFHIIQTLYKNDLIKLDYRNIANHLVRNASSFRLDPSWDENIKASLDVLRKSVKQECKDLSETLQKYQDNPEEGKQRLTEEYEEVQISRNQLIGQVDEIQKEIDRLKEKPQKKRAKKKL